MISIGLIASGVFAPVGLVVGLGVSFGLYGGYAAFDAHQNALAMKKHTHAWSEEETPLLSAEDELLSEPEPILNKASIGSQQSKPYHVNSSRSDRFFKPHSEPVGSSKTMDVIKNSKKP